MGGQCTTEAQETLRLQETKRKQRRAMRVHISSNRPLSCALCLLDSSHDTACQLPSCSYLLQNISICMHVLLHFVDCPQSTRILTIHMSHAVLWYMFTPQVPCLLTQHSTGKRLSSAMSLRFSQQWRLTTCIRQCGSRSATTFAIG